jgi:F5/8 type C domain-containing protein
MNKDVHSKTFTDNLFVNKIAALVVVSLILELSFVTFFSSSNAMAQLPSQDILSQSPSQSQSDIIPQARLIYNSQYYGMSPFVFVNNGQLNKIQFPSSVGDFQNGPTILRGSPISFQYNKQPLRIDAFVADYESDVPELFILKKIDTNTFQLSGPVGLYNIEIHAIFADGQYTSHTILANIIDNGPTSPDISTQQTQSGTTQGTLNNNDNNKMVNDQSCNRPIKLLGENALVNQDNNVNLRANALGSGSNIPTWSTKGIDILSFASAARLIETTTSQEHLDAMTNTNPWIRLDLGANNLICNIGITFRNGDSSVNYFTLQTSTDGVNFNNLGVVETTPVTASGQAVYYFPNLPDTTRYVRIANLGNVPIGSVNIAEMTALGS